MFERRRHRGRNEADPWPGQPVGIGRWPWLAAGLAIGGLSFGWTSARAGSVTGATAAPVQPTAAAELGDLPRTIRDVEQAVKSFRERRFDDCLRELSGAVKSHPELAPPHALFAKLAFLSNQGAMIRPALERAVAEDAQHPEVYILLGNLALVEGRITDGAVHFEKARAMATSKRWTPEHRRRFERLCHQGEAFVAESRGDWKGARAALTAWLELEPGDARARHRLGLALFGAGEYEKAHSELARAAEADAGLEPAAVAMGWLYARERDSKKAGEWMDYAVKSAPGSSKVRVSVARWLLEQGRAAEARTHLEAAAKIDPKSTEVRRMMGLAARECKELAAAEKVFQALSDESPGDAWARNQLAMVLAEQPDDARRRRAVQLAELSVRQDPRAVDGLTALGTVYYRLRRLDEAEKVLRVVVASGKGNSDAAYMLALVEAARGHADGAAALIRTALSAPGLFVARNEAREWLDRQPSKAR